ncbi:2-acylglycerol O-acyltransferase 2-A [Corythoichthys intestinalis]|uniref:2-acylglycerol O-acyltransferase 2-A n=1 Tax=Corythoichthys intestinalis TaxID=161448 RepID=UPI0025A62C4B|nr:2-acylglycerol O-acyltransferase 2-A [Corythoichthys intestinalis]XP_061810708.1 2-acylglycerol O-acyltransferase 2-A-like [Nerophis lumbriciformis]
MKIHLAPLNVPLRRRLQTAAVLQWIFSFLGLAQCCLAAFILLSLSTWWMLALLYATWLWLDSDTPNRGGRRCEWIRRSIVWEYFRDYFPIKLVKTVDLEADKNYVFGFHPHGVLATGAFGNFCTESTGFSALFPGLKSHLLMLPFWFRVPIFRDYIMSGGLVSSSKSSLSYLLSRPEGGNVAVIAVGAAPEALDARPGALTLQLRKRKGFIKLALRHGAQLVPVFSFGENELFDQVQNPTGSPLRTLQDRLQSIMGISMPLFNGRGIFQYSFGLLPHRKAILTVVGTPIQVAATPNPTSEDIDALHEVYLEHLSELFERHKHEYGLQEHQHLNFI